MKNWIYKFALLIFGITLMQSCTNEVILEETLEISAENRWCDQVNYYNLIAGQNSLAGKIMVRQDGDYIILKMKTREDWEIEEYHIYIGVEQELPRNKTGNPKIGHFPYVEEDLDGEDFIELQFLISELGFIPVVIAVHAVVSDDGDEETAWIDGIPFAAGSWAEYVEYEIEDCTGGNTLCTGFRTLTQDEWGDPNLYGGQILSTQFNELTPLTGDIGLGCPLDSVFFTNGTSLLSYLPDNGSIVVLPDSQTDPTGSISSLLGEITSLRLNLAGDANILGFSTAESALGDQVYLGPEVNYNNRTVNQVLYFAEQTLGGCLPLDLIETHSVVQKINGNYSLGVDNGHLDCPFD